MFIEIPMDTSYTCELFLKCYGVYFTPLRNTSAIKKKNKTELTTKHMHASFFFCKKKDTNKKYNKREKAATVNNRCNAMNHVTCYVR